MIFESNCCFGWFVGWWRRRSVEMVVNCAPGTSDSAGWRFCESRAIEYQQAGGRPTVLLPEDGLMNLLGSIGQSPPRANPGCPTVGARRSQGPAWQVTGWYPQKIPRAPSGPAWQATGWCPQKIRRSPVDPARPAEVAFWRARCGPRLLRSMSTPSWRHRTTWRQPHNQNSSKSTSIYLASPASGSCRST